MAFLYDVISVEIGSNPRILASLASLYYGEATRRSAGQYDLIAWSTISGSV